MSIPNEIIVESIEVPKDLAAKMKDIPRRFNETLTAWAERCKVESSPQAKDGE